ncbi:MAG: extradiol ring-cleavage dioxygenase, partial [Candidatus Rokuibacteriota bacterium]
MAEILGLGLTHYPPLIGRDERMADILRTILRDPGLPERLRDPGSWPEPMRREYGDDGGTASAAAHRDTLLQHLRRMRRTLDEFRPDLVVVWGDDQHENFVDDIIPPFCILAYDRIEARHRPRDVESNVWGEGPDTVFRIQGHREAGKYLARRLLEQGVDMPYAYRPLHHEGLAHAFLNTVLFLDYDRVGFPYPVLPFQVNCYGRRVIAQRGFRA